MDVLVLIDKLDDLIHNAKRTMLPGSDQVRLDREEVYDILVVDFARRQGAAAIIKGLRAISDFEYESEMTQLNRLQAQDVESVFIMASPQYSFLSSSGVKELATFGGDISELVPPHVEGPLKEALAR